LAGRSSATRTEKYEKATAGAVVQLTPAELSPRWSVRLIGVDSQSTTSHKLWDVERSFMGLVILILVILLLLGGLPTWGYSRNWGYGPSGGLGFVLLIVVILMLMGRI
jgi:hypothetical protein